MKKKILFIINPISGMGRQHLVEKLIDKKLDRNNFHYELTFTKASKNAIELSRNGVNENFDVIVAVGGDGSVNEVGRSLVGTNTTLAILPCGSGNGTARHFNMPMNLSKAMEVINRMKTISIDTFSINSETVINVAGIGYAAHIAYKFSKFKKRGFKNYLMIAVRDSMKYKSQNCKIIIDGKAIERKAFIIDIANGSQWGNNAYIAPLAKNNDGLLDVCIVNDFPFRMFPLMATRLFTKSINKSKFVETYLAKEITLTQERNYAHIDGEPTEIGRQLTIKINPLSLKVIVP